MSPLATRPQSAESSHTATAPPNQWSPLVTVPVTPTGARRPRAQPPVPAPTPSRTPPTHTLITALTHLWRAGSVTVLLGGTALVWLIGVWLSPAAAPTTTAVASAPQLVAQVSPLPTATRPTTVLTGPAPGPSGGSGSGPAPKPAAAKSSDSGSNSGGSSAPKPAASSNSPSNDSGGSGSSGGSSADHNPAPKPAPSTAPASQNSGTPPAAKPTPTANPATDTTATPPSNGAPKPATPQANAAGTPPTGTPKPPGELEPGTDTTAVAHKPGQPDQTGPSLSPVLKRNAQPTLLSSADPMAPLVAKYRTPGQPNQGGGAPCGPGCPTAPPAAPVAPAGPSNAGTGAGGPGQTGGSGGPARLAGAGQLAAPDTTHLADGAPLRNLLDPTQSPGAARSPPTAAETLLGQPDPAQTGRTFYRNLLDSNGAAATRMRSLRPDQIEQLATQGSPRTAQDVLNLATGTQPAPAGTVAEWDRQQAVKQWFADSRNHPADFGTFAAALPATERAKLNQAFEDNKPGQLSQPGGLSYWGRQASKTLTTVDDWGDRNLGGQYTPGSWEDRWNRSARNFVEGVPAQGAKALDDLLTEDEARNGNPHFQPLAGESAEQADQRLHPFKQDVKDARDTYTSELGPLLHGDTTVLRQRFHDDPVGTAMRYVPFGGPLLKGGGKVVGAVRGARATAETTEANAAGGAASEPRAATPDAPPAGHDPRGDARADEGPAPQGPLPTTQSAARVDQSATGKPSGLRPTGAAGTQPAGRSGKRPTGAAGTGPGRSSGLGGHRPGSTDEPSPVTAGGGNKPLVSAGARNQSGGHGSEPLAASAAKPGRTENPGKSGAGDRIGNATTAGGQGATHGPGHAEDPDSATTPLPPPGGDRAAYQSAADSDRSDVAQHAQTTVEDYLGRSDVRHALARAAGEGLTVKVDGAAQSVPQVIADRLPEHPGLVQALTTANDLHSSLLTRPKAFANLLTHPQAAAEFEAAVGDLNRLGPQQLLDRAQAAPARQPVVLTPAQRNTVDALRSWLRDLPARKRVQDGFDKTRSADKTYLREYLAESKAKAAEAQPQLNEIAQNLAGHVGGKPGWRREPKDDTRAMDKINDPKGARGDASQLVDLAGAKVEFGSISKVYQALEQARQLPGVKIVRFKDRLVEPQKSGYGDLLLNLRMSNEHVGELRLQLTPAERISTDYEHALYESVRDLDAYANDHGRELTPRENAFTKEILRRTNSLYQEAFTEGSRQ